MSLLRAACCCLAVSVANGAPLFELNLGQSEPGVRYTAREGRSVLMLRDDSTVVAGDTGRVAWRLVGANPGSRFEASEKSPVSRSYLRGDRSKWVWDAPLFGRVVRRGAYAGIDVAYHAAASGAVEYDYVVQPGADPRVIRLRFDAGTSLRILPDGSLAASHGGFSVRHKAPVAYDDLRAPVAVRFERRGLHEVGFAVGEYDRRRVLTIDPELVIERSGGSGDEDVISSPPYLVGSTTSADLPASPPEARRGRDVWFRHVGVDRAPVTEYVVGGSGDERPFAMAVGRGRIYVVGETNSRDLPANSFQTTYGGGTSDGFILSIPSSFQGSAVPPVLLSYFGGSGADRLKGVRFGAGRLVFAGETDSADLPGASVGGQTPRGGVDAFLAEDPGRGANAISVEGLLLFGGSGDDFVGGLEVTPEIRDGVVFPIFNVLGETVSRDFPQLGGERRELAGESDAFWAEFDAGKMRASRIYGGSGRDRLLAVHALADGKLAVVGDTTSTDLPGATLAGGRDLWLAFFDGAWGANVVAGGSGDEALLTSFAQEDVVTLGGATASTDLKQVQELQAKYGGGESDGIVVRVRGDGSMTMASYLGGDGRDAVTSICACDVARVGFDEFAGIAFFRKIGIGGTTDSKGWGTAVGGADIFFARVLLANETGFRPLNMAKGILTPISQLLSLAPIGVAEAKFEIVGARTAELTTTPAIGSGSATVRAGTSQQVWLYPSTDTEDALIRVETEGTGPFLVPARLGKYRVSARPVAPGALVFNVSTEFVSGGVAVLSSLSADQIGLYVGDPAWRVEILTPETIGFDHAEAFGASAYDFPFSGFAASLGLRLRQLRPGPYRVRVRLLNDVVEPAEVSGEIQARSPTVSLPPALFGTPREGIIGVTTGSDLAGDIRVTSLSPDVVGLSLRAEDPPSRELVLQTTGAIVHRVFVRAVARSGVATIRVSGAGMATVETPIRVYVPVLGLAPVVFPILNLGSVQQGSVNVFSYDTERMETGFGALPSISGPIPLRLGDPSIARLSAQELARPGPFNVTGLREGVTELTVGGVGDIGVMPSAARAEIRVAPMAGIGASFTVGANLRTTVSVALPFTPQQVAAGVRLTSSDPSKLLFRTTTTTAPTAQNSIPSLAVPRIDNLSLHGRESGDLTLRIEAGDGAVHEVRVQVQPAALLFGTSSIELPVSTVVPVEIAYHPIDPATGMPGTPQFWDGVGTPALRFRSESGGEVVVREVASRVPGRRSVDIEHAPGRKRLAIVQPENFFAAPAIGGVITLDGQPYRFFGRPRTVIGEGTQQILFFSANGLAGKRIVLRSSDTSKLVVSNDPDRVGPAEFVLGEQPGGGGFHYLQSLQGTGEVLLEAEIEGEEKQVLRVSVVPIVARWEAGTWQTALFPGTPRVELPVQLGLADGYTSPGLGEFRLRPGGSPFRVSARSSNPAVLRLIEDSIVFGMTGYASFPAEAIGAGNTELLLDPATAIRSGIRVTVAPRRVAIVAPSSRIVTQHTQEIASVQLAGADPRAASDMRITLTSSDPSRLVISTDRNTLGGASATATIPAGRVVTDFFYLHALRGDGDVTIEASGNGVQTARMVIGLRPAGLAMRLDKSVSLPWNVADGPVRGRVGLSAGNEFPITPRPGARITGSIRSSAADVASVTPEAFVIDSQPPSAQFDVRPSRGGSTTLRIDAADEYFAPGAPRTVNIEVARTQIDVQPAFRGLPPYGAMLATVRVPEGTVSSSDLVVTIRSTRVRLTETLQSPVANPLRVTIPLSKREYAATFWIHWPGTELTGDITAEAEGYLPRTVAIGAERGVLMMADGEAPFRNAERLVNATNGGVGFTVLYGMQLPSGFVSAPELVVSTLGGAVGVDVLGASAALRVPDAPPFIAPGERKTAAAVIPANPGSATVRIAALGFDAPSTLQLQIYRSPYLINPVSARMARNGTVRVTARWQGLVREPETPLVIRTANINIAALSANGFGPPMDTLSLPYVVGTQIRPFVIRAGETLGSTTVRIGDDAYLPVQVTPAGLTFASGEPAVRRARRGAPISLIVQASLLEPGTLAVLNSYTIGPPQSVPVQVTLSASGIVSGPSGDPVINGGNEWTALTLTALAPGQVEVRLVQPPGFSTPATGTSVRIVVE